MLKTISEMVNFPFLFTAFINAFIPILGLLFICFNPKKENTLFSSIIGTMSAAILTANKSGKLKAAGILFGRSNIIAKY